MTQIWDSQRREWESQSVSKGQWRFRPILPIVFYTGEQRWTTPLTLDAIMDIPDVLSRFVPKFDTLFLGVKDTDESELTKTDHPFGWLLTVLQKEQATVESLSEALIEALSHISTLDEASAQQRRRAISYLLLLILHRRPFEEQPELTYLLGQHVQQPSDREEVELMAQTMAEHLIEQGKAQGIEQGQIQEKQAALLKLLESRFDTLSESITKEITSTRSLSRLDLLFDQALSAKTLDEISLHNHDG